MQRQSWGLAASPCLTWVPRSQSSAAFLPANVPVPDMGCQPGTGSSIPAGSQQQIGAEELSSALKILSGESGERKWLRFSEIRGIINMQPM